MRATWINITQGWRSIGAAPTATRIRYDLTLAVAVLALTALGVVMVYSAGAILAEKRYGDPFHLVERQTLHVAIGLGAFLVAILLDVRIWQRLSGLLYLATFITLLAMLVIPQVGTTAGGATRWLQLGSFSFQPSELAKLAILLFLSRRLARDSERITSLLGGYLPTLGFTAGLAVLILLQPDFGAATTLVVVAMALLYAAGARMSHMVTTALAAVPVLYWLIDSTPYRRARLLAFLDPFAHRREEGYQIYESIVSFASGGWTGVGLGQGPQKLGYFPEYHNDFVLSSVGEELGLLGVAAVVGCFCLLVWRGLRIARQTADRSLSLLAFGITALLGVQALVHMGVVMALLPTKGIPLPFVSYGGTSLVLCLFLAGLLLNIGARTQPEGD